MLTYSRYVEVHAPSSDPVDIHLILKVKNRHNKFSQSAPSFTAHFLAINAQHILRPCFKIVEALVTSLMLSAASYCCLRLLLLSSLSDIRCR